MTITQSTQKVLNKDNMNPLIKQVEYAVRGRLAIRSEEIRTDLENGKKYPFDKVVSCNIGNPQQLNQTPITFFRQVKQTKPICYGDSLMLIMTLIRLLLFVIIQIC